MLREPTNGCRSARAGSRSRRPRRRQPCSAGTATATLSPLRSCSSSRSKRRYCASMPTLRVKFTPGSAARQGTSRSWLSPPAMTATGPRSSGVGCPFRRTSWSAGDRKGLMVGWRRDEGSLRMVNAREYPCGYVTGWVRWWSWMPCCTRWRTRAVERFLAILRDHRRSAGELAEALPIARPGRVSRLICGCCGRPG